MSKRPVSVMSAFLPSALKDKVLEWRQQNYDCGYSAISEIFEYAYFEDDDGFRTLRFLRKAQFEALETYWYLRLIEKTPKIIDLLYDIYNKPTDLLKSLGVSITNKELIDLLISEGIDNLLKRIIDDDDFVKRYKLENARETLSLNYPSYIFALAMGAGKTYLIGTIIATEFSMAIEYPNNGFVKNALVFAPGKTILGALKDISNIPFDEIIPTRLYNQFMSSMKITYTQDGEKDIPVILGSSFNIIVTNTEKIRIQKSTGIKKTTLLNFRQRKKIEEDVEIANLRLLKIASLPNLAIFSDEAHHTYGRRLDNRLKKIRKTVDFLADNTNVLAVINTTGTPYYKKKMLKDVVYWYSLSEGIKDGILKEVRENIISFEDIESDEFVRFVIEDFFKEYGDISIYNGSKTKLAIYFPQTQDLKLMRSIVEKKLIEINENPSLILEVHNKSKDDIKDLFNNRINEPSNPYRIFMLVNMGTEGWNCPSLFATALARKLKGSNNFVLQAASRCLRQIVGNEHKAKIYLSKQNVQVLDRQLQETFGETLTDLYKTPREMIRRKIYLRKFEIPEVSIIKKIRRVEPLSTNVSEIKLKIPLIEVTSPSAIRYRIQEDSKKILSEIDREKIDITEEILDLYKVAVELCSIYRINLLDIYLKLKSLYHSNDIPVTHIPNLRQQIEEQLTAYEIRDEEVEFALALIKPDGFKQELIDDKIFYTAEIMYHKDREHLLISYSDLDFDQFGFHYNPYKFDSKPEKDFFIKILEAFNEDPDEVEDVYFIGGFTDPKKTDFLFEYLDKKNKWRIYSPDFLIKKINGKILIIEIKAERFQDIKKEMALRKIEMLNPEQIKYEVLTTNTDEIGFSNIQLVKEWVYYE